MKVYQEESIARNLKIEKSFPYLELRVNLTESFDAMFLR